MFPNPISDWFFLTELGTSNLPNWLPTQQCSNTPLGAKLHPEHMYGIQIARMHFHHSWTKLEHFHCKPINSPNESIAVEEFDGLSLTSVIAKLHCLITRIAYTSLKKNLSNTPLTHWWSNFMKIYTKLSTQIVEILLSGDDLWWKHFRVCIAIDLCQMLYNVTNSQRIVSIQRVFWCATKI